MTSDTTNLAIFLYKNDESKKFNFETSMTLTNDYYKPKIQYGYNYYIDNTKENMNAIIKENSIIKYDIVNNFSVQISNYEENINNDLNTIFEIEKKLQMTYNNNFFMYWEIFNVFKNIFMKNENNITTMCNNEIISSLNIFCNQNKISYENNKKKKSNIVIIHSDEKVNYYDKNIETKYFQTLVTNIINILTNQIYGGSCIINITECYTEPTVKILYILSLLYEEFYIYKPSYSKIYYSEKIIICKKFKYNTTDKNIQVLISSLTNIREVKHNVEDIFLNENISTNFKYFIKYINYKTINLQYKSMNNIIDYIKSNDIFGKKYHDYRNNQINNYIWWKSIFFTKSSQDIEKICQKSIQIYTNEFNKFIENLYDYF